jgi:hypothetical protein
VTQPLRVIIAKAAKGTTKYAYRASNRTLDGFRLDG